MLKPDKHESKGKIWFGDVDLTVDAADLQKLANEEGETVFILLEMDGRFRNEASPLLERAVKTFQPNNV